MKKHGRLWVVVCAVLAVGLGTAACGSSASSSTGAGRTGAQGTTTRLDIAEPVLIVSHAPLYVAIQKGYFAADHIDVSFSTLQTASTIAEALTSGSIQMASGASFNVITADNAGAHYQAIVNMGGITLQLCTSKTFESSAGIPASGGSPAAVLARYKGATLGLTGFNSPPEYILNYLLRTTGGVNPQTSVREVSLGSVSAEQAALQRNEIQAFFQSPPTCSEAGAYATPVLTTSSLPALRDVPYAMLYSTTAWISAHQTEAREIAQAIAKADAYVKANPAGAAAVLHQSYFPTVSAAVLQKALTSVVIPAIPAGGAMTQQGWQSADDIMTGSGAATKTPSAAEGGMWTNSELSGQ